MMEESADVSLAQFLVCVFLVLVLFVLFLVFLTSDLFLPISACLP